MNFFTGATSIDDLGNELVPTTFSMSVHPNPFNPSTTIVWVTPDQAETKITVFDAAGREVAAYEVGVSSKGQNEFRLSALSFPSGLYFYKIESGAYSAVNKFILLK